MKFVCLVILFVLTSQAFSECRLRVRVAHSIPQYSQDINGNWQGLGIELIEVLLNEAKCKPDYVVYPWKRSLTQLREGKVDMMVNLSITSERKEYLWFIGPQRDETIVLMVNKNSDFKIDSLDDIKALNKKIGVENGAFYGEEFDNKYKTDPAFASLIVQAVNTDMLINMLEVNRIIGFFEDRYSSAYKMKTLAQYKDVKTHSFLVNQGLVYFGFSKKSVSVKLLARLQKAYERASAAGRFEAVIEGYR
jgi:polar amino acid transport system substrate-binding protein